MGTNIATVARIYINNGMSNQIVIPAPGQTTGVAATGVGGTCGTVNLFCKTMQRGQGGDYGTISAESTSTAVTGPTGSVTWTNATPTTTFNISGVMYYVGRATNQQAEYFWAPASTVTVTGTGTVMTVTAIVSSPLASIGSALNVGSVFTTSGGMTAGDFIVSQVFPLTAGESMGGIGRYNMSASRTFTGNATTNKDVYVQLTPAHSMINSIDGYPTSNNSTLIGEISLPATTASITVATPDIDYMINAAIPPGYDIYVGIETAVAAGWQVTSFAGSYST